MILSPREWGARVDYDSWDDPFTPDDGVALHHGGSGDYPAGNPPFSVANEIAQLRAWEAYHLSKGWKGLAYGFGVGQSGTIYRIRGFNRYGAHTGDMDGDGIANNEEIIPIIWIASGNHHTMSPQASAAIEWLRRTVIEPRSPAATILYGHLELKGTPTSCPGAGGMDYVNGHRLIGDDEMEKIPLTTWARPTFARLIAAGVYTEEKDLDKVRETYDFQQLTVMMTRLFDMGQSIPTDHSHLLGGLAIASLDKKTLKGTTGGVA